MFKKLVRRFTSDLLNERIASDVRGRRQGGRLLRLESLEDRQLLSAVGYEIGADVLGEGNVVVEENIAASAPVDLSSLNEQLDVPAVADSEDVVIVVDALVDDATDELTSLREAIAQAGNTNATITFDASLSGETYSLTENLTVEYSIKIDASALTDGFTIDGAGSYGLRTTGASSRTYEYVGLTFANCDQALYIKNGNLFITECSFVDCQSNSPGGALAFGGVGGSYRANVNATIVDSSFENCACTSTGASSYGGAVFGQISNSSSTTHETTKRIVISGTTFDNCDAGGSGGAIYVYAYQSRYVGPIVSVTESSFTDCGLTSSKYGGAIYIKDGELNVDSSTFDSNGNSRIEGGAICLDSTLSSNGSRGSFTCTIGGNTSFTNNVANLGGAIYSYGKDGTITIDGGENKTVRFEENSSQMRGGAINIYQPSYSTAVPANVVNVDLYIQGAQFLNNSAGQYGGGVFFQNGEISNSEFIGNEADYGGAVVAQGLFANTSVSGTPSRVTISDTNFAQNSAKFEGGAILVGNGHDQVVYDTTTTLSGTVSFVGNTSNRDGGAMTVRGSNLVLAEGSNVNFEGNEAVRDGGAVKIYIHGTNGETSASVDLTQGTATFSNNSATDGGAIYLDKDSELSIGASTFAQNEASGNGGALYVAGAVTGTPSVTNNQAGNGGAVFLVATSNATFESGDFSSNAATNGGSFYVATGASVDLSGLTLDNNVATKYGGAVVNQGTVTINGGTYRDNVAALGGFYYGAGTVLVNAAFDSELNEYTELETETTFVDNNAVANASGSYGSGGAFYVTTRSGGSILGVAYINNATFEENAATKYGGAIANYGVLTVLNSDFVENVASSGGAVQSAGTATIVDSVFESNEARRGSLALGGDVDFGGNGGAIFTSNNGSTGARGVLTLEGENVFNGNVADNAGGAIDLVSGALVFGDADTSFTQNRAEVVGGALVIGGDVDFGDAAPSFLFDSNSAVFAATVAVNCAPDGETAAALKQGFNLSDDYDSFDTFVRTVAVATPSISFDYLRQVAGVDSAETITYTVSEAGSGYTTIDSTGSITFNEEGTYNVYFYVDDKVDVQLKLTVTVSVEGAILARPIDMSEREPAGIVGFVFVSYGKPVSKWVATWSDDGTSQTYETLGYSQNAYKICDVPGTYSLSLSVTYVDGTVADYGEVATYRVKDTSDVSGALIDDAFADESLFVDFDF